MTPLQDTIQRVLMTMPEDSAVSSSKFLAIYRNFNHLIYSNGGPVTHVTWSLKSDGSISNVKLNRSVELDQIMDELNQFLTSD